MTSLTLVDAEGVVQEWAESDAGIAAATGSRIFFAVPIAYNKTPVSTWIVMTLVSEAHQVGDLGLQEARIQFNCNGKTKLLAATVALAVQSAARQLSFGLPKTVGSAVITWADVSLKRWLPDPTLNTPRYVVDVLFAMHGAEA